MQEYVEERTIAISVKAAKLSGKVLAAACKRYLRKLQNNQGSCQTAQRVGRACGN
mgnify:CR=1 FL=1